MCNIISFNQYRKRKKPKSMIKKKRFSFFPSPQ